MIIIIYTFLIVLLAQLIKYYYSNIYKYDRSLRKMDGPRQLPLLRNAHQFGGGNPDELLNIIGEFRNKYGDIFKISLGPLYPFVVVSDPGLAEAILSSPNHIQKSLTYNMLHPWLGEGLLTSSGKRWQKHRKIITPTFHFQILEQFVDIFHYNEELMINKLKEEPKDEPVDIYSFVTLCTLDIICETAMGVKVNAQQDSDSEYVAAIKDLADLVLRRTFMPWLFVEFIFKLSDLYRRQKKDLAILHQVTRQVIATRKEERKSIMCDKSEPSTVDDLGRKRKKAFLDLLLDAAESDNLSDEDIENEVDTFMFEGHDTTASGTSFCLWMISHHQDVQEKLVTEVNSIFGDSMRPSTFQDLQNMKYMEQVIKETLRLYPSVPIIGRQLENDLEACGYKLLTGTSILLVPYFLHRNKAFPDPEKFDPERFSSDNTSRSLFSFAPFSAGPRNCIGQKFAMMEMKSIISSVLRNFKLMPVNKAMKVRADLVLKSTDGIPIYLVPRHS